MRRVFAVLMLLLGMTAAAQEGYPLDGTWRGEVTDAGTHRTIVLIMSWDGGKIHGTINPGPDAIEFERAVLRPSGWKFSLAARNAKDEAIAFEGALADIGHYNRTLTGKWNEGKRSFDIRFVRE